MEKAAFIISIFALIGWIGFLWRYEKDEEKRKEGQVSVWSNFHGIHKRLEKIEKTLRDYNSKPYRDTDKVMFYLESNEDDGR